MKKPKPVKQYEADERKIAELKLELERLREDIKVYVKTRDALEVENEQLAADLGRARNDLLRVGAELERLHRIEEATRRLVDNLDIVGTAGYGTDQFVSTLRAALREEA